MPLGAQLPAISRVFAYFFPLSQGRKLSGCPGSATATQSLSDHHIPAGSVPTSCGIPLAWPTAGNTDALCCPHSTLVGASSTGSQCAARTESRSRSSSAPRRVCPILLFVLSVSVCTFDCFPKLIAYIPPSRLAWKRLSVLSPSQVLFPSPRRTYKEISKGSSYLGTHSKPLCSARMPPRVVGCHDRTAWRDWGLPYQVGGVLIHMAIDSPGPIFEIL